MTEKHLKKQYWINTSEIGHIYINDGENHMSWQGVVDTLNTLNDENEQLGNELNTYKEANKLLKQTIDRLQKENEELKQQREELFIRERNTKNDWRELKQENKQLKKRVDDVTVAVEVECCKVWENVLALIDKKIEEIQEGYNPYARQGKCLDGSNRQFAIIILQDLKKRLEE